MWQSWNLILPMSFETRLRSTQPSAHPSKCPRQLIASPPAKARTRKILLYEQPETRSISRDPNSRVGEICDLKEGRDVHSQLERTHSSKSFLTPFLHCAASQQHGHQLAKMADHLVMHDAIVR